MDGRAHALHSATPSIFGNFHGIILMWVNCHLQTLCCCRLNALGHGKIYAFTFLFCAIILTERIPCVTLKPVFSLSMHWNTARCKLRYHELPSWKNRSVCLRIQDWVKWYFKQSESITFLFNISFQSFAFPSQHHVECVILCFRNVLRRLYLVKCIYLL